MSGCYLVVADLDRPQPEPFAVLEVFPARRTEAGGCEAVVVSLHMTRNEAELVVASGGGSGTLQ